MNFDCNFECGGFDTVGSQKSKENFWREGVLLNDALKRIPQTLSPLIQIQEWTKTCAEIPVIQILLSNNAFFFVEVDVADTNILVYIGL